MLEVTGLSVGGILADVSFSVRPGERVGIIGESGSGKSMTALAVLGLLPDGMRATGSVSLAGREILNLPDKKMRALRGSKVAMVFQEPMTALDPMMTVGRQVGEACGGGRARVEKLFSDVGLAAEKQRSYPHELSGGQRQRVLIALAMAGDPDVLIADEPTTALDVTSQDQVLGLLERLVAERGMSLVFISHDLAVIARMCGRVGVMRDGRVVESGPVEEVLRRPRHEYTRALVAASRPGAPARVTDVGEPVIRVEDVSTREALREVSLTVRRGERLGVVGGSGAGKTTLLRIIAGLAEADSGAVRVDAGLHVVFQDPQSSLNPRLRVGKAVAEGGGDAGRVAQTLAEVGLPTDAARRFPAEFSGGQRQRISIARAVAGRPEILLADEPVSALDVSVRSQVLGVLDELVEDYGLTLVFVSHDLSVVRQVCSTVAVMHEGRIVEHGATEEVWAHPQHEYTRALLAGAAT
jgi:peptide/nickel transport system ATP-binding protein